MLHHRNETETSEQNTGVPVRDGMRLSSQIATQSATQITIQEVAQDVTLKAGTHPEIATDNALNPGRESLEIDTARIEVLAVANRRRKRNLQWMFAPITMICLTLTAAFYLSSEAGFAHLLTSRVIIASLIANYAILAALLPGMMEKHSRAVRALTNTEDVHAVGQLTEALFASETANSIAGTILIRLLPRIRPEDTALFTVSQRGRLRDALAEASNRRKFARYNPTLALAILQALSRIGTSEDIPILERLTQGATTTEEQRHIASTAATCLAELKARIAGISPEARSLVPYEQQTSFQLNSDQLNSDQLNSEKIEALASRLHAISRLRQRNVKVTLATAFVGIGLAITSIFANAGNHSSPPLLQMGMLGSLVMMLFFAIRGLYTQRNLTQSLMHTNDLRLVAPLLQAAATGEVGGEIAAMILIPLLGQMRASDSYLLDASARENLNRAMATHGRNTEFLLAALQALQQVGDETALPVVQKLAGETWSRAGQSVRESAQACLPFLQQRALEKVASQTLLRASDSTSSSLSSALLRPVQEKEQIATEELLRPHSS